MTDLAVESTDSAPRTIYLKDYAAPAFLVDRVALHFELDPEATRVRSRLDVRRNPAATGHEPLRLDGQALELLGVTIDGRRLGADGYRFDQDGALILDVAGDHASVEIETLIHPAANTALEGLYVSSGMFCTQCEAEGFRRITYFPDRPDVMARYATTIVADKGAYPVLLSNGNLVERGELDGGRHWARWEDPFPKPSYLFALVAGNLVRRTDRFVTRSGRNVDLHLYVEPANAHKCDHALASLKQAMTWDEQTYGREYDLDIFMIVAVNDFNMGAMENKGLNIFNSACVLASPDTATDDDYYGIQSIIGHEYFHNWSGNRVTCRDWFQLSLKEGFTVFRDQQFSADLNSAPVKRIADVNMLRNFQFAQDASPMAHPVRPASYIEISNFYTVTVYNKGAEVVRMLRTLLGADGFRRGTDLYFERHDGQAVTTDDFVAAMEHANQVELTQFKRWYSQAGTPVVAVSMAYDEQRRTCRVTLRQSCPPTPGQSAKEPFHIPLLAALLDPEGESLPLRQSDQPGSQTAPHEKVIELKEAEQTVTFTDVRRRPVLSINRGFSAPIIVQDGADRETLTFLLARDSDPFNRWEAGQRLAISVLLELVAEYQRKAPLAVDDAVLDAFGRVLDDTRLDPALVAQTLTLPSESYLADQCDVVDVDAIHAAREHMRRALATRFAERFMAHYQRCKTTGGYRFDAGHMARRSLKNLCLAYLMESAHPDARNTCVGQFEWADNMTDSLAALSILAQMDIPERRDALDAFYQRWKNDPLVVNKWFSIQAGSRLPDTLQQVHKLMQHPAFAITNPNNVRSVIGRFCQGNARRFHEATGEGYRFLTEQVMKLDRINPQIAARLVGAFSRWHRYDPTRQALMRGELEKLNRVEKLSKDVFEIVSKSLKG